MRHYCTIEEAISEIDDNDVKNMLTKTFKTFGYNPNKDSVDSVDVTDLPRIAEGIILGAVDILKNDEGVIYAVMSDYLYFIFYQSKLFPTIKGLSSISIQLRSYFMKYLLDKQIPELILMNMEQGIYPQFYSATVINEIRKTQFYKFFNEATLDEIIHSVTLGSNDINTTSICVTVIDELIEDILANKTDDCYEEITELVSKAYMFKRTPSWMYDDLDSTYRKAEITAIFTVAFGKEEKDMPIKFDEDSLLTHSDKIYRQNTTSLLNDIVTTFSAHTSEHRTELLDKFVVTNSSFQKTFDTVFSDYVNLFSSEDIITFNEGVAEEDVQDQLYRVLLYLTSYTMCYIIMEFLWILKKENIAPVTYSLILTNIVREILCYRIYEVNPT